MRLYRPGLIFRILYPAALCSETPGNNTLYLTFDDGPVMGSTERILEILGKYGIKAMFFCTGGQAEKHPDLKDRIISEGHLVGNHGYRHIDGLRCSAPAFVKNAEDADSLTSGKFFRPPYGRMSLTQYRTLAAKYRIVLWDLMPYDFDTRLTPDRVLWSLLTKIRDGSLIVLHDKIDSHVHVILEDFILKSKAMGYSFGLPASLSE